LDKKTAGAGPAVAVDAKRLKRPYGATFHFNSVTKRTSVSILLPILGRNRGIADLI
jgi:hypothetical protein